MKEDRRSNGEKYFVIFPCQLRSEPGSASWKLCFAIMANYEENDRLKLRDVYINGFQAGNAIMHQPEILPFNKIDGGSLEKAKKLKVIYEKINNQTFNPQEQLEILTLSRSLQKSLRLPGKNVEIYINPAKMPFEIKEGQTYQVRIEIETAYGIKGFNTPLSIINLPFDVNWKPAQLHVHSTFSDGNKSPAELAAIYRKMGYKILYITDHADLVLQNTPDWSVYEDMIFKATTPEMSVYAGLEITTQNKEGDLLAYGVSSPSGLENKKYKPQELINNIYINTSQSSSAVAHPCGIIDWEDWSVINYSGFELMSSVLQINYDAAAPPMEKWVSELARLLPGGRSCNFPSARAGDDWHATVFEPVPPGYVTYLFAPDWKRKSAVDLALLTGKSVASRSGGLGYFHLYLNGIKYGIGEIIFKTQPETTINFMITFKPVLDGDYKIKIMRDNNKQEEFYTSDNYTAGNTYYIRGKLNFPGGKHFYYLYISGTDFIYSSPIFIYG